MKKLVAFFISVFEEFKKIRFPKRKEVINTSAVVLVSVILFSGVFYVMDLLSWLFVNKLIVGL